MPSQKSEELTFVVVGAGPTASSRASSSSCHTKRCAAISVASFPAQARVVLLGAAPTILPEFPERLRDSSEYRCEVLILDHQDQALRLVQCWLSGRAWTLNRMTSPR